MLAKERLLYILKRLQIQPSISVIDLAKELSVSKSTVQRDLRILENKKRITRERGGAVAKKFEKTMSDLTDAPVLSKINENIETKKAICSVAAGAVHDGDLIFIDSGTTPSYLIQYLQNKKIKIVTYNLLILSKTAGTNSDVYMLGGEYNPKYEVCYGPITVEQIKQFRFDHAFIGANGVDTKLQEVYTSEFEMGALKKAAMERSVCSYLLVDSSKFDLTGLCTFGYFKQFDAIYVDRFPKGIKKSRNIVEVNKEIKTTDQTADFN
ncbi:DeoR/GlpR family DNA-binding transcription regulator [Sporolactobacillus sp. CQH2019]|uniref:DeoR/GlpR family DNA-binding transcription regulator n=1 Tax=Sporolactobacillus sp. CQH2019 TaxID=3023512 RepID=UPI002367467F|nr:DeoR/GlpR family DNA-binding transcription regulator [Sporolactobacillus sp. CQH2019]MDD9147987.1 DeoR/GlpR family DNA-binding transcription regulator [Sporolactobacillus sp. CQH2019]